MRKTSEVSTAIRPGLSRKSV
ncbi:hypothetical protein BOS5A_110512 [Bosea sp. EC-HK365B]|nr:hypothetical protein BOSE21B_110199 [Bosea sp. 21B]CAD5282578.1 hypothetical protein BOSE7B_41018 [Bosea sp. 7B]VVT51971.1 hypothetical protein BOS5A_110512 [Bosea sp. EC-HK365B]VXC88084.1 hypothetical protein BOSE127_70062 [Bosea sp. 127]